jgi:pyridoxamine 5'-phosphate oxidase
MENSPSSPDTPTEFAELRENYQRAALRRADLLDDPIEQFRQWFDDALDSGVQETNAMSLATADADGRPSVRTVLLKGIEAGGFEFFTNYESRKGRELDANPHAALVFLWKLVERQICIRGRIDKLDREASEKYFRCRPYGSRIGAWVSPQSEAITDHQWLQHRVEEFEKKYPDTGKADDVPLPDNWGGYRLMPEAFEFWQGRPNRLHDRFGYQLDDQGQWQISRLSP